MELYYGVVRGNRIELDNGEQLTDGLRVEVRPQADQDFQTAEETFKEHLRAAGRLAPASVGRTIGKPRERRRIHVQGEPLSEQIIRERR